MNIDRELHIRVCYHQRSKIAIIHMCGTGTRGCLLNARLTTGWPLPASTTQGLSRHRILSLVFSLCVFRCTFLTLKLSRQQDAAASGAGAASNDSGPSDDS